MKIVIIDHPEFSGTRSIFRYTEMIAVGLRKKDHSVEVWRAKEMFSRLSKSKFLKKYLEYLDRFLVFPLVINNRLKNISSKTLFVFADQALGPWIPLLKHRPHVVHCHDFMAQRSALGEVPQNKVGFTGKLYQSYIRKGYRTGKYFISISEKTKLDLHRFLLNTPAVSEVVYNGLNLDFKPGERQPARQTLQKLTGIDLEKGYVLHVGGDLFYKNREGVVEIYNAWSNRQHRNLPLLFVGALPGKNLEKVIRKFSSSGSIHFLENVTDDTLKLAYQGASVLLYPSIDEGFGWPIAEALASGCPVITTNKAPMNEVGGSACLYLPCRTDFEEAEAWITQCADILETFFSQSSKELEEQINGGLVQAQNFNTTLALERIEKIYEDILLHSASIISTENVQRAI